MYPKTAKIQKMQKSDTFVLQNVSKSTTSFKCLPPDAANPGLTSNDVPKREKYKEMDYKIRVYVVHFSFF